MALADADPPRRPSGITGPVAYFDPTGKGNTWTGNFWDTTSQAVPS